MEDELLKKLKNGLKEEIQNYESMLKICRDEQEVLKNEGYSHELISLASEKLRLMNRINQIGLILSPLKAMWMKEREKQADGNSQEDVEPLVTQLGNVLEELLAVDRANTKKLTELTEMNSNVEPVQKPNPVEVGKAYKSLSHK
jgi:hypothetical protein